MQIRENINTNEQISLKYFLRLDRTKQYEQY